MGLGIDVRVRFAASVPDDPLSMAAACLRGRLPEAGASIVRAADPPMVSLVLHPTAEPVELSVLESGVLRFVAKTSTTGPGYHAFLVDDVLDPLVADLSLELLPPEEDEGGDETGYLASRDFEALQREMLSWLRGLAAHLLSPEMSERDQLDVCMSIDVQFQAPGFTRTPLGPRDAGYWRAVEQEPSRGVDFFAWWERGRGAGYWRGLALSLLWNEVRFRPPADDDERALLARVAGALERAHELDPDRALPWREWAEVLDALGAGIGEAHRRAGESGGTEPIGYLRHPVRRSLNGGWSLVLPGALRGSWDDGTYCAFGDGRTVWFTSFSSSPPKPVTPELLRLRAPQGALEEFEWSAGGIIGAAWLTREEEDDGGAYWMLTSHSAFPGSFAIVTVCFGQREELAWAADTWRSLRNGAAREKGATP